MLFSETIHLITNVYFDLGEFSCCHDNVQVESHLSGCPLWMNCSVPAQESNASSLTSLPHSFRRFDDIEISQMKDFKMTILESIKKNKFE